jgi:flagellar biosynthesis/type III secretory pathway protein FliH
MSESFVPLAAILRPPPAEDFVESSPPALTDDDETKLESPPGGGELSAEWAATYGEMRRFRAGVLDALEVAVRQLLGEIAENVLARELQLGAADIASIVAKARERFRSQRILTVRVHPDDRDALGELAIERIVDDRLSPGDVIAELQSGTIDLRLRTRLEIVLAAVAPC